MLPVNERGPLGDPGMILGLSRGEARLLGVAGSAPGRVRVVDPSEEGSCACAKEGPPPRSRTCDSALHNLDAQFRPRDRTPAPSPFAPGVRGLAGRTRQRLAAKIPFSSVRVWAISVSETSKLPPTSCAAGP